MKAAALAFALLCAAGASAVELPQRYGEIRPFSLLDQTGESVTRDILLGRAWVANFIFTRCEGPCPVLSSRMAALQKKLAGDIRLVSISVDPGHDRPDVLRAYAERFGAQPGRWLFLTGDPADVRDVLLGSFHVAVNPTGDPDPGSAFLHSTKFALVDAAGSIRGYYDGDDDMDLKRLQRDARRIEVARKTPWALSLPHLNALLNAAATVLLLTGFQLIRRKNAQAHRAAMSTAFAVSVCFLISYLLYHRFAGSVPYLRTDWTRPVYFALLLTHTVLAAVVPPLALLTFYRAWKGDFQRHAAIARWTLPIWLYVSVTGVVIYWMLYRPA